MTLNCRWLRYAGAATLFVIGTIPISSASLAHAEKLSIDIPAGEAPLTLVEFVRQTGLQMVFDSKVVEEFVTSPVIGEFEADAALRSMLAGTGLSYDFVNRRTITVTRSTMGAVEDRGLDATVDRGRLAGAEEGGVTEEKGGLDSLDEIIVTGTHIRGISPSYSPVTVFDRDDIYQSGAATLEQFMRQVPQNLSSVDAIAASSPSLATGLDQGGGNLYSGAGFNLRGLGAGATLVLLNGQRITGAGVRGSFVDISKIPLSAIEKIEIVSDGASAIYGSDAIAGVANIVLRTDFDGAETTVRAGGATRGGAGEMSVSQAFGKSWVAGNGMLIYEYNRQDGLLSTDRRFLPDTPLPVSIVPEQRRDSAVLSGRQAISPAAELTGAAFYSDRDFVSVDSQNVFGGLPLARNNSGTTTEYGGGLTLDYKLSRTWHGELSVSHSEAKQSYITSLVQANSPPADVIDTRTSLTTVDARTNGVLFRLPGGDVRAAVGVEFREEDLDDNTRGALARDVFSVYSEVFVPIVGEQNSRRGIARLELSVAGRYDRYSDVRSSSNPKFGLMWGIVDSLKVRGSYATSFRAPPLTNVFSIPGYFTFQVPDASAASGFTNTLFDVSVGNPSLGPETSETVTFGIDLAPIQMVGTTFSATYFKTKFQDRISSPPLLGGLFQIYSQSDALSPFIDRTPNLADVTQAFASPGFFGDFALGPNGQPLGSTGVEAVFDARLQNIASTTQSGIELSAAHRIRTGYGEFGVTVAGNYFQKMNYRAANATPVVSVLDQVGHPIALRFRGGLSWRKGGVGWFVGANYWDSYSNIRTTPPAKVSSWTTLDTVLSYETSKQSSFWITRGLALSLNARNLFDRRPPSIEVDNGVSPGFDTANADPLGRTVALDLRKSW